MDSKFNIVIPARLESKRLHNKLLREVCGKPIIQWTWENSLSSNANSITVVTDSEDIKHIISELGGNVFLSKKEHESGTDRINEFISVNKVHDQELIINLQGDEPLLDMDFIDKFARFMVNRKANFASMCKPFLYEENLDNPNRVKVAIDEQNKAILFSRKKIEGYDDFENFHHIGVYGYDVNTLKKFASLPKSKNEIRENLEQLRALDNKIEIHMLKVQSFSSYGIDTEDDLEKFKAHVTK
ncbi:MAG: 3-deoxy-manno-octulosonate cytidylyltransferase [SAR86 cluster bacterium]|nr:3-deoxy-manno-octulosonate cytidylyltransferase [SAR86 cluster bacterium]